ncbi:MAG TPA: gluconate 2-dehydrogenase subunit 3 family protein [Chloroflexota bacterium]|nr:gluconate 2-dehydrogenase subunit 3 family protein [Chloroflexota bacterium]
MASCWDVLSEPLRVLTPDEAQLVAAIAERIFPATDTPGAVEAGAITYIDWALAGDYQALLPLYREGLQEIERLAQARFGRQFARLSEAEQDAVLIELEGDGQGQGRRGSDEGFFQVIRRHVLEGIFGEPRYGGNRDLIGWNLVGFGGQQFGYEDPYINRTVDLPARADD